MIETRLKYTCHKCDEYMYCDIITTDEDWVDIEMISNLASFTCDNCKAEYCVSQWIEIEEEDEDDFIY